MVEEEKRFKTESVADAHLTRCSLLPVWPEAVMARCAGNGLFSNKMDTERRPKHSTIGRERLALSSLYGGSKSTRAQEHKAHAEDVSHPPVRPFLLRSVPYYPIQECPIASTVHKYYIKGQIHMCT